MTPTTATGAALPPVVPAAVAEAARVARHAARCGGRRARRAAGGLGGGRRRVWPALRLRLDLFPEVLQPTQDRQQP